MTPRNHPNAIRGREKLAAAAAAAPMLSLAIEEPVPARSGHPTGKRGVDDTIDDRETPPCVFDPLWQEFDFTLDAAASHGNAKCNRYCTLEGCYTRGPGPPQQISYQDGLEWSWTEERVWLNPPFSGLRPWVEKAWEDAAELVCMLLPNNRGEQPFWQTWIEPYRDRPGSILTTRNLPKRRPFLHMGETIGNRTSKSPPFGLVVVIWDRRGPDRLRI
jgi:hypothetical protein